MKSSNSDKLWQPRPACTDARLRHWLLDRGWRLLVTEVFLPATLEIGP